MLGWRRVLFVVCCSGLIGLILVPGWTLGPVSILARAVLPGLGARVVFGLFEQ